MLSAYRRRAASRFPNETRLVKADLDILRRGYLLRRQQQRQQVVARLLGAWRLVSALTAAHRTREAESEVQDVLRRRRVHAREDLAGEVAPHGGNGEGKREK